MPIVRVDIPEGYTAAHKERLRQGIKKAVDEALVSSQNNKFSETRNWLYVSIHEAFGKIGDGLPTVIIDTCPGQTQDQKDLCADLIFDVFEMFMDTRNVYVLMRTTDAVDHLTGAPALRD